MEDKTPDPPNSPNPAPAPSGQDQPQAQPGPDPQAAQPAKPEGPPLLSIDEFMKLQLRVAQVLEAEPVEKTDKLMRLQVDLGSERRQIIAGVAQAYSADALIGKRIILVANLKPARIRGVESQGMLLAADLDGRPIVATFDEAVQPGTRVR